MIETPPAVSLQFSWRAGDGKYGRLNPQRLRHSCEIAGSSDHRVDKDK